MLPALPVPEPYRLSYEDWLGLPEDPAIQEVIHGELIVTPAPNRRHQLISSSLLWHLMSFFKQEDRGQVYHAPTGVRFGNDTVVEPDLLVIVARHSHRLQDQHVEGPPDLVVEILSAGSAGRDLNLKRRIYESGGVPEYWIVDPQAHRIEVLVLSGGGFERAALWGIADTLQSPSFPGLEIPLADVFRGV